MRVLVLDEQSQLRATELRRYAEKHRLGLAVMEKIAAGVAPPAGTNPRFSVTFPGGYRVVYTIEQHPLKLDPSRGKWFHHISCSVDSPELYPHPAAIIQLMEMFGIEVELLECLVYLETPKAVNVIAPYEGYDQS